MGLGGAAAWAQAPVPAPAPSGRRWPGILARWGTAAVVLAGLALAGAAGSTALYGCAPKDEKGAASEGASCTVAVRPAPSPNTPAWVNHIAFRVDSVQALEDTKARLQAHGIEVLGVTDHHIFKSIYFFDPNGIRLELTAQLADELQMLKESKTAHARLDEWTARKEQWRKERAEGKSDAPLKPQSNDRPEFVPPK